MTPSEKKEIANKLLPIALEMSKSLDKAWAIGDTYEMRMTSEEHDKICGQLIPGPYEDIEKLRQWCLDVLDSAPPPPPPHTPISQNGR